MFCRELASLGEKDVELHAYAYVDDDTRIDVASTSTGQLVLWLGDRQRLPIYLTRASLTAMLTALQIAQYQLDGDPDATAPALVGPLITERGMDCESHE